MWNNMIAKGGHIGFGLDAEEAENDWYVNKCKESLALDAERRFTRRLQELKPWLPNEDMLHITGVGCLVYKDGELTETRTSRRVRIGKKEFEMFYYLSKVLGDALSYTDIVVVLQRELNQFFYNISNQFIPIGEYPIVKVAERSDHFNPETIYYTTSGALIGCTGQYVGLKELGDEQYHIAESFGKENMRGILSYIGYRVGVQFSEGGVGLG